MRALIAILFVLLSGCVQAKSTMLGIYGLKIDDNKIKLRVTSTGCTKSNFFKLNWQKNTLLVEQTTLDSCRRMPHLIWVEFDLPKDKKEFVLANSILTE